jgi:TRAP-type mannitol/chloroaromatic compound transport system permease small subunit
MVAFGVYNALTRWSGRFIGIDLSSNGFIEAQWYLFTLLFLLGAAYTLKHNEHVRVDVFYGRLNRRGQAWIDLLGTLFLLLPFCIFGIVFTWSGVVESWQLSEVSPDPGGLPRYPLKAVVPLAFLLLIVQAVSEVVRRIATLKRGAEDSETKPNGEVSLRGAPGERSGKGP